MKRPTSPSHNKRHERSPGRAGNVTEARLAKLAAAYPQRNVSFLPIVLKKSGCRLRAEFAGVLAKKYCSGGAERLFRVAHRRNSEK